MPMTDDDVQNELRAHAQGRSKPRQAWTCVVDETGPSGFVACLATEGQPGYQAARGNGPHAEPWYLGTTYEQARATAEDWNRRDFGLEPDEAAKIVASSMDFGR